MILRYPSSILEYTRHVFRGRKRPHSRELDFGNTRLPYNVKDIFSLILWTWKGAKLYLIHTWFPVEIRILQYIMASVKRIKYLKISFNRWWIDGHKFQAFELPWMRGTSSSGHLHEIPLPHELPAGRKNLGAITNQAALYIKHSKAVLMFPKL